MIGDGFCNDETNNPECNFDGGDCCGPCIVKNQCSRCTCLQSDVDEHNVANALVGDGYCNDETNNPDCSFDGGDCCGPCINTEFCSECQCHLGNLSECYRRTATIICLQKFCQYEKPNCKSSIKIYLCLTHDFGSFSKN